MANSRSVGLASAGECCCDLVYLWLNPWP